MPPQERQLTEVESNRIAQGLTSAVAATTDQQEAEGIPQFRPRARRETSSSSEQTTPRA
jgi:hypothetical protein